MPARQCDHAVMDVATGADRTARQVLALRIVLLTAWGAVSFGACFFARDLQFVVFGWPFGYWFAAQGAMLAFIAIVTAYALVMKRLAPEDAVPSGAREDLA
jgi:putative solute:sodium symporter small subunit